MKHHVIGLIALLVVALSLAGCPTKSDAERCKDEGGVWRDTFCEKQAK